MSRRPTAVDGPVVDGPAIVNGGIQHREVGASEVAMDVAFSDVGEQLAPTTTITTVAVQAGKAKIVLAILKVRPSSISQTQSGFVSFIEKTNAPVGCPIARKQSIVWNSCAAC